MADKRFRGRDKIVQKMTKDGLVEENLRTGETKSAVAEEPPKQEDSEKDAAESAEETPVVEEDVCMDAEDGEEEKPRRSTAKQSTEYYKAHQEDGKPKEKDAPPVDEDAEPAPKKKGRLSFDDEQQGGIVRGAGLGIKKVAKKGVDQDVITDRRDEYTGALVMGRRKKIDVNTTSVRTLPEDKWIIAENAHEAIVTKDEYYQAQKAIRNVTPIQYKVGDDFALKGKICCGNCNRQLRHERQYGEMVFYCGYKRSAGKFSKCYGGYYREYSVNAKVARAIKTVFYALDVVNQGMQEKQSITVRCMDIEDLEKQAEAIRVEQIKLYESYADGVLLRDAYIEKKKALSEKLAALQDSIRTEKEEQECADELDEEIRALTKQASEKTYIGGLTKECVDAFVSMVYLYDDQTMKIEFNCEDVIRRALEKYGA